MPSPWCSFAVVRAVPEAFDAVVAESVDVAVPEPAALGRLLGDPLVQAGHRRGQPDGVEVADHVRDRQPGSAAQFAGWPARRAVSGTATPSRARAARRPVRCRCRARRPRPRTRPAAGRRRTPRAARRPAPRARPDRRSPESDGDAKTSIAHSTSRACGTAPAKTTRSAMPARRAMQFERRAGRAVADQQQRHAGHLPRRRRSGGRIVCPAPAGRRRRRPPRPARSRAAPGPPGAASGRSGTRPGRCRWGSPRSAQSGTPQARSRWPRPRRPRWWPVRAARSRRTAPARRTRCGGPR